MSVEAALIQPTMRATIIAELLNDAEQYACVAEIEQILGAAVRTARDDVIAVLVKGPKDDPVRALVARLIALDFVESVARDTLQE